MKVSCLQEHLAKGLSVVGRAVSPRSTLPVLANVLIATDSGRLKLSATNLEIVITCWIDATIAETGATTLPARTFSDLVNQLPREQVELELSEDENTLHIAAGRIQSNVRGIHWKEFPEVPSPDRTHAIRLDAPLLKRMIQKVVFAAAADDTRPTLTGVLLEFSGTRLRMAATDAFRLSVVEADIGVHVDEKIAVIVPARSLQEVARVIDDDDEDGIYISVPGYMGTDTASRGVGGNQVIFSLKSMFLVSQLIEGTFPDFSPIIPSHSQTRAVMSTGTLLNACKTADIFARESSHTARVHVSPGNELMDGFARITATSKETGDNEAQVDASVEGGEIDIAFNVRYLNDVLSVIDTAQVALEMNSPLEPGVVRPVGGDRDSFFHVIMPMHYGR